MSKSFLDKNLPYGGTPTCAPLKSLLSKIPPANSIISARVALSGTSTIPLLFILPHIATFLLELLVIFFSSSSLKTEKTEPAKPVKAETTKAEPKKAESAKSTAKTTTKAETVKEGAKAKTTASKKTTQKKTVK